MPGCSIKWIGQRGNMPYLLGKVNDPGTERVRPRHELGRTERTHPRRTAHRARNGDVARIARADDRQRSRHTSCYPSPRGTEPIDASEDATSRTSSFSATRSHVSLVASPSHSGVSGCACADPSMKPTTT